MEANPQWKDSVTVINACELTSSAEGEKKNRQHTNKQVRNREGDQLFYDDNERAIYGW